MKLLKQFLQRLSEKKPMIPIEPQNPYGLEKENKHLHRIVKEQRQLLEELDRENSELKQSNSRLYRTLGLKEAIIDLYIEKLEARNA